MTAEAAEPFTPAERREDLLDEAEGIWSGAFANGWDGNPSDIVLLARQYARVERTLGVEGVRVRLPVSDAPAAPQVPICARGHLLDEENTIKTPIPELKCRTCRRGTVMGQKTHCRRGHPLAGSNVYINPKKMNWPECRTCRALVAERRSEQTAADLRKLSQPHATNRHNARQEGAA